MVETPPPPSPQKPASPSDIPLRPPGGIYLHRAQHERRSRLLGAFALALVQVRVRGESVVGDGVFRVPVPVQPLDILQMLGLGLVGLCCGDIWWWVR